METNETILSRGVVALDDRKILGKICDLRIDCEGTSVSHCVLKGNATNAQLIFAFEKTLGIGDTFATIQTRDDIMDAASPEAKALLDAGFKLVGVEVFSRSGNRLGKVGGFEFDSVHGDVTKIILDSNITFSRDKFVFFAPDFVFVEDGKPTAADLRAVAASSSEEAGGMQGDQGVDMPQATADAAGGLEALQPASRPASPSGQAHAPEPAVGDGNTGTAADTAPRDEGAESRIAGITTRLSKADNMEPATEEVFLRNMLVGSVIDDDVVSHDGEFRINKGEILTLEQFEQAREHDALLLLTMSVQE